MAVSFPLHPGSELPGEVNSVTKEIGQRRMQIPAEEPRAPTKGCSIDMIAAKIGTCAKARVFAIMLFNLLVFDGQLSKDRSNWSCPFGHCKLNFADKHGLLQHVLDCPDFSSDKVFCNCCTKDDHFEEHCRDNRAEKIASHGTPSKKRNPIQKISDMFSRRTESRSSPSNSEGSVSSGSTPRRQQLRSLITSTPSLLVDPRRGSTPIHQESSRGTVEPGPSTKQTISSEPIGSETYESQELPASEVRYELSGTTKGYKLPGQMFDDIMEMKGSPTEDFGMDPMIHDEEVPRPYNASYTHEMEASNAQFPPAYHHDSVSQPQPRQQSAWSMQRQQQQELLPYIDLHAYPVIGQEGLYSTGGSMSDLADLTATQFQQRVPTPGWRPEGSPMRKASGDSGYSDGVNTGIAFGHAPRPDQPSFNGGCVAVSPSPTARILEASNIVSPESVSSRIVRCPYEGCTYSPSGHPKKHAANLKKHINTRHRRLTQVRCLDCGNWYSRSDNLKVHQEGACVRSRSLGAPYPANRSARRSRAGQEREWGGAW
ncbi:hypothetical protein BHE90_006443 [Fusarium euwallaceae]|uniref:C2H2-type domain-containing protein n=2 Tax=Fusarium solani species complex TaxID=232080 RepID=A0A3M2SF80_9HYPO|nr:hypothetical protein CDV36_004094 [Fusarium kuroshium]RTE79101.1 hypothetical protein BHE90_006443 [Fusarium euwallaceae]